MADWQNNAGMYWNGNKISDHGRSELDISFERIGSDTRTVNGTKRRQHVALKRTISASWENLPSKTAAGSVQTADGGLNGDQMQDFVNSSIGNGAFRVILRNGSAIGKSLPVVTDAQLPYEDNDFEIFLAMITDFSKQVVKRGQKTDLWSLSVTLEEV